MDSEKINDDKQATKEIQDLIDPVSPYCINIVCLRRNI